MVVGGERTWQQTEAAKLKPYTATHGGGGGAKEGFVSAQPISRLKLHVSQNLKINVVGFLFRWKSFTKSCCHLSILGTQITSHMKISW